MSDDVNSISISTWATSPTGEDYIKRWYSRYEELTPLLTVSIDKRSSDELCLIYENSHEGYASVIPFTRETARLVADVLMTWAREGER